jgi:protease secretion system outer membrane protein
VTVRVASAYMDALFADDQVRAVEGARDMYAEQMHVNQRLFEKGEGTKTDMLETQARLDLAEAQLTEAQDNAVAARETLAGMIGMDPGKLDKLGEAFRPARSRPAASRSGKRSRARTTTSWRRPAWRSRTRAWTSASPAGHYPRVDFIASLQQGRRRIDQHLQPGTTVNRAIGVQVNIPIYQGGAISATTRQAVAGYERASPTWTRAPASHGRAAQGPQHRVEQRAQDRGAGQGGRASGKLLMKATEQSIKGGVRINLDLLNAQQQLYTSQRDLAQARYTYLIGLLRLRAAAGTLGGVFPLIGPLMHLAVEKPR